MMTIQENRRCLIYDSFLASWGCLTGKEVLLGAPESVFIPAFSDVFTLSLVSWILDNSLCFVLFMSLLII